MQTKRLIGSRLFFGSVVCLGIAGCHPLDRVAWDVEGYGTISVSAPLLVPVEKAKEFDFDLDKSAEFYYSAPRVEGAIRLIRERAVDVQFALSLQVEQLLSTLTEMKAAATPAQTEAVRQKLTKQALAIAALQKVAEGPAGAAAIAANPLLMVGLDALAEAAGIGSGGGDAQDQGDAGPEQVPDDAAPPKTVNDAIEAAGPQEEPSPPAGGEGAEEEPAFKSLLPLSRAAKDVLSSKTFSAPLSQYTGPIGISPRQALSLAANDKMTQDLFNWFAKPQGFGTNKKAYFCMMTVSCHPGYWTKKNFSGDVLVTTEYGRMKGGNESPDEMQEVQRRTSGGGAFPNDFIGSSTVDVRPPKRRKFKDSFRRPLVAAVFPMVDSQVLDLRHSLREQTAGAISLALLGFGGQAELIADFVDRLEQDAQTQTAFTIGSAYSAGGYSFGFRIEPRFAAIGRVPRIRSGPGTNIQATQFPAMVLLFVDKTDVTDDVGGKGGPYDHVAFHVESRWLPRDWWTALWWRHSEYKMIQRAKVLDRRRAELNGSGAMGDLEYATLKRRRWALGAAGLGSTIVTRLPAFPPPPPPPPAEEPEVTKIAQNKGWVNAVSVFLVEGKNFSEKTIKGATVDGRSCAVQIVGSKTAVVICDAWGECTCLLNERGKCISCGHERCNTANSGGSKGTTPPHTATLWLATTFGPKTAGDVTFVYKYGAKKEKARPSVTIERAKDGNITGVKVTGVFEHAKGLLGLIHDSLLCCDKDHYVCVKCGCGYHKGGHCCCKKGRKHQKAHKHSEEEEEHRHNKSAEKAND